MGGLIGLDYGPILGIADRAGIPVTLKIIAQLQILERAHMKAMTGHAENDHNGIKGP